MECEMSMVERRFKVLRKHLDDLGYRQPLVIDALPLVERLVSDLLHTTESLQHYKQLAQQSLEECNQLGFGIEPYRQDNAKLVQETNDLHLKLLHSKEDAEKSLKELRAQLRKLENENADLQFVSSQHLSRVKALELESAEKSRKILKLQGRSTHAIIVTPGGKKKSVPFHRPTIEIDSPLKPGKPWQEQYWSVQAQAGDPYIAKMCDVSDQRINCLWREVNQLKEKSVQQTELITTYKNQLKNRDVEITRLSSMLEGGRPIAAVSNDCCFIDMRTKLLTLSEDNKKLDQKNKEMDKQIKEITAKHRDASAKAARLSDRNRQLEQEMHDIDHMALTVEAECNSTVKENTKLMSKLKASLEESLQKICNLEREMLELKRNNQEGKAELDKLHNEKKNLQKILDSVTENKKQETERTNHFTAIENDLNMEIDRLTQVTNAQKLQIAELQNRVASNESQHVTTETTNKKSSITKEKISSSKKSTSSKSSMTAKGSTTSAKENLDADLLSETKGRKEKTRSDSPDRSSNKLDKEQLILIERLQAERDLYFKEFHQLKGQLCNVPSHQDHEDKDQSILIERLQAERDLYFKEFHELKGQLCNIPNQQDRDENCSLRRKLDDKTRELTESRQIIRELNREKTNLQVCVDAAARVRSPSPTESGTMRSLINRLEHERDLARGDVVRLEEERAAVRERLRIATEAQVSETGRFERLAAESEERIRVLEAERRECINGQATLRATVNNVTAEMEEAKVSLTAVQQELSHQRMLYSQIKALHEQTDRALADATFRLAQADAELTGAREQAREAGRARAATDRDATQLKAEVSALKRTLAQVDGEKDELLIHIDEKTERAAHLEHEVKERDSKLKALKERTMELQAKLDVLLDENACQGQESRRFEAEVQGLRQEICNLQRVHENSLREIRRLTDDVTTAAKDSCTARRELEQSRQECENLKRQLQDYVAEVRRVEELLQQKEGERNELLDHFRSLSQEATVLETNNHSLGHEAETAKSQLQCVENRVTDLEVLIETKDTLVRNYESQLAELTSHVACLESQLQVHSEQKSRLECDVAAVRDLCMKLDCQKADLIEANAESDAVKIHLDKELSRLREEHDELQDEAARDRCTIQSLEHSLSSSRQETLDGRKSNQELKAEVAALHRRIDELQERLEIESNEVRRYQKQAAEYSQHVSDLRREVTNERFERARSIEETRRAGIPGCPCPRAIPCGPGYSSMPRPSSLRRPGQTPCICPPNLGSIGNRRAPLSAMSTQNLPTKCPHRMGPNPVQGGRRVICLCPQPGMSASSQVASGLGNDAMRRDDILGCTCGPDDKTMGPEDVADGEKQPGETAENSAGAENAEDKYGESPLSPTISIYSDGDGETRPKELYQPDSSDNRDNDESASSHRDSNDSGGETRPKELYQAVPATSERNLHTSSRNVATHSNDSDGETRPKEIYQAAPPTSERNLQTTSRNIVTYSIDSDSESPSIDRSQSGLARGERSADRQSNIRDKPRDGPANAPQMKEREQLELPNSRRTSEKQSALPSRDGSANSPPFKEREQPELPNSRRTSEKQSRTNMPRDSDERSRPRDRAQPEASNSRNNEERQSSRRINSRDGLHNERMRSEPEYDSDASNSDGCDDEIALRISLQRKCDECPVEVDLLISNGQATKTVTGGKATDIQDVTEKQKAVNVRQNVTVPVPRSRSRSKSPKN